MLKLCGKFESKKYLNEISSEFEFVENITVKNTLSAAV